MGTAWSDWSEIKPAQLASAQAADILARLPELIDQEFGNASMFFVKDPRMCRMPGVWLEALAIKGIEAKVVIPIRHPTEVARSLESRNRIGKIHAQLTWLRHVLDAEHGTRDVPRVVIPYTDILSDWGREVDRMSEVLGLQWPVSKREAESKVEQFLSAELRHFSETPFDSGATSLLSGWLEQSYELIQRLAGDRAAVAMSRLDEIRRELNLATSVLAPAFTEAEALHLEKVEAQRKRLEAKLAGRPLAPPTVKTGDKDTANVNSAADMAKGIAGVSEKLAQLESRLLEDRAARDTEISKLCTSFRSDLVTHFDSTEQYLSTLATLTAELQSRRQLTEDLDSRLRESIREMDALQRRFDQSLALHEEESRIRKAINSELELIVSKQQTVMQSQEGKLRAEHAEVIDLRSELDKASSYHASEVAKLQLEVQAQMQAAQGFSDELAAMRGSRGWKLLTLLRRAMRGGYWGRAGRRDLSGEVEMIEKSGLFDREWYLARYPDVARTGLDPIYHYLHFGAAELRNPSLAFDTRNYLDLHPDLEVLSSQGEGCTTMWSA
jgi:hypothetical protein